jgi:SAM-dependent methyltransferase
MTPVARRRTGACPVAVYESGLRAPADPLLLERDDGMSQALPVTTWRGNPDAADHDLLARCGGPTLDVGCGPGRLTAALARAAVPALGIDVAPTAVALTRRLGAAALRRDVFGPVPGTGRWHHALLVDGNIGIGGDPVALLRRLRALLRPPGQALVEVAPAGTPTTILRVRLRGSDGVLSRIFPWAEVGADGLAPVAARAGFAVQDAWTIDGRHFAALVAMPR